MHANAHYKLNADTFGKKLESLPSDAINSFLNPQIISLPVKTTHRMYCLRDVLISLFVNGMHIRNSCPV